MRITCPTCAAQYDIDGDDLDVEGQDVQCSDCLTIWMQSPEGGVSEVRAADSLADGDEIEEIVEEAVEVDEEELDDALAGVEFDDSPPHPDDTEAFEEAEVIEPAPMPTDAPSVIAEVISDIMPELAQEVAHSIVMEEAAEEETAEIVEIPTATPSLDQDDFAASLKSIFDDADYDDEPESDEDDDDEEEEDTFIEVAAEVEEDDIDDLDFDSILGDDALDNDIAISDAEALTGAIYDVTDGVEGEEPTPPQDYTPPQDTPPIQEDRVVVTDFQQLSENAEEDDQPWDASIDDEIEENLGDFNWDDTKEEVAETPVESDEDDDEDDENLFGSISAALEETDEENENLFGDEDDQDDTPEEPEDDGDDDDGDDDDDDFDVSDILNEQIAIEESLPDAELKPGSLEHGIPQELIGKRARVPDISKLRTTLSATDTEKTKDEIAAEKPVQYFRRGFVLVMLISVALTAVYTGHPQLIAYAPEAAPFVETYLGVIDSMRLHAQNGGDYLVGLVQGLMG